MRFGAWGEFRSGNYRLVVSSCLSRKLRIAGLGLEDVVFGGVSSLCSLPAFGVVLGRMCRNVATLGHIGEGSKKDAYVNRR